MQQNRRHVLSLLGALLAGCASSRPIDPKRLLDQDLAVLPLRIVVEPFEGRGLYADRGFVNRGADRQSGRSLIGPPALLFGDVLVDHLRVAYGQDSVLARPARFGSDVRLRPALQRLERVPGDGADRALLAIEFVVNDSRGVVLGKQVFSDSLPAGSTPAEYLAAQAQLLACACEQSRRLLDRSLPALGSMRLAQR
ncbi:hypothetical protein [Nevskia sp.]|uniref:hypothetical protein n=1 Tax=Nevskia sp. TaxID=1929292 RepID=UPI0025D0DDA2|nr:hypothetical protein [Nevskia sp.]